VNTLLRKYTNNKWFCGQNEGSFSFTKHKNPVRNNAFIYLGLARKKHDVKYLEIWIAVMQFLENIDERVILMTILA